MPSAMDRAIEKKRWPASRVVALGSSAVVVLTLGYALVERSGTSRLRVDPARLTTAMVEEGDFREYYPFDGTVEPVTTVFLDVEEGGRVEEIVLDGGQYVHEGDLILRLSNTTLQRNSIDTETRLVENLNSLRNTQLTLAQNSLLLRESLLDLEHRIRELDRTYQRYTALLAAPGETDGVLSREVYERTGDELEYLRERRKLLLERIEQEEILSRQQLEQADASIERLNLSLDLLGRIVESLEVRAPISGFLSSVSAQVGQNITHGQRIGQIDILDAYKVAVSIDQYYISQVELGTTGRFALDGESHGVVVERIYPEVVNDAFTVDVGFLGPPPASLRRGQRLTVELTFGEPRRALVVARGGFQQRSGGRWVYLVAEDRRSAKRVPIRLGRQNPRLVEVLEGLRPGDWIITSSYDAFNEADALRFTQPIDLLD